MKYYQTFVVTGGGYFPLDMLRYDSCWPRYEREICLLNSNEEIRSITIARRVDSKSAMPTLGRWASFGWKVDQNSIQTVKV